MACAGTPEEKVSSGTGQSDLTGNQSEEELTMVEDKPAAVPLPAELAGTWEGKLTVGLTQLRMVFHLKQGEDKQFTATVDSPDQGAFDIPVSRVAREKGAIILDITSIAGKFSGKLTAEQTLDGNWYQGGQVFPLVLEKRTTPVDYTRPQDPVAPYPYQAEEVTFSNEGAGITLGGTLTYPESDDSLTAVILISGSGAQNRNEEVMGHRPFLVLADHLSRAGIAVLRYDDRGVGESGGDPQTATSADYATDVEAAIAYLNSQQLVKIHHIGLIGHSEGGIIAPMVAEKNTDVDFIVMMAGPGCRGDEILMQQTEAIMRAKGMNEQSLAQLLNLNRSLYDLVINAGQTEEAEAQMKQLLISAGLGEQESIAQAAALLNPWFIFFLSHDPVPVLEKISIPVLAINGDLDLQVLAALNLPAIEKALISGGNQQFTVKLFTGLNHLFQHARTGLMDEYSTIEETISPEVLDFISTWIGAL
jgi:hypothetical protein